MTKEQYFQFHKEFCEKMTAITRAKNADYTGSSDDPFANFARVEQLGIASTEQGFLTRMTDKLSRLSSFAKRGTLEVKDESVEDTLKDLANYCILLAGYLRSKKEKQLPQTKAPAPTTVHYYNMPQVDDPRAVREESESFSTRAAETRAR